MSNDRNQVLELLAAGKVNANEAAQLLDRLAASAQDKTSVASHPQVPKFMCVRVDTHKGDAVNVRIPLALAKTGIKLSAMMPKDAAEAMTAHGVDFAQLSKLPTDELFSALQAMQIDVLSKKGDKVKVYCEC